jgi:hypothetical protein
VRGSQKKFESGTRGRASLVLERLSHQHQTTYQDSDPPPRGHVRNLSLAAAVNPRVGRKITSEVEEDCTLCLLMMFRDWSVVIRSIFAF